MGIAVFEVEHILHKHNVHVLSSNYSLYADMSRRVMEIIKQFTPEIEIYSVDEAFIRIDHTVYKDPGLLGKTIRQTIMQWLGISVSIGIAPTKTLTKVASEVAKTRTNGENVCVISSADDILRSLPVEHVWGVGRQYAATLLRFGITTAYQLKTAPHELLKIRLGVQGLRLKYELSGISCIPLKIDTKPPKSIMYSRTFGHATYELISMQEAVSSFTHHVCVSLRQKHCVAQVVHIRIETGRHDAKNYIAKQAHATLPTPTDSTLTFLNASRHIIERLWEPNIPYKRVAVTLLNISANSTWQKPLYTPHYLLYSEKTRRSIGVSWMSFGKHLDEIKHANQMYEKNPQPRTFETIQTDTGKRKPSSLSEKLTCRAMDTLNESWGKDTVRFASMGTAKGLWHSKSEKCSPRYTTRWDELLVVT